MSTSTTIAAFCVGVSLLLAGRARAQEDEYRVKAAILYNIAKFVDWPSAAFAAPDAALGVCVLGTDPFGSQLDETFHGRQVHGRAVTVHRSADVDTSCHIMFVSRSERKRRSAVLERVSTSPVLTIGDDEGFGAAGGMVELATEGGQVRVSINNGAAQRAGLRVSARLLALAAQRGWLDVSR
jgi:hypothetical protein